MEKFLPLFKSHYSIGRSILTLFESGSEISGGPDSMFALNFLLAGKRSVTILHFDHGTEHAKEAKDFVLKESKRLGLDFFYSDIKTEEKRTGLKRLKGESDEMFWRKARYSFFRNWEDMPTIMGHTLDDQVESWLFSSLRGNPRLIPYRNRTVIRPFLSVSKGEILRWCERKGVEYVLDPSNTSDSYSRSYIRKEIVPRCLRVNPGLYTTISKKVLKLDCE